MAARAAGKGSKAKRGTSPKDKSSRAARVKTPVGASEKARSKRGGGKAGLSQRSFTTATGNGPARAYGILFNDDRSTNPTIKACKPGGTNTIADVSGICVGHAYYIGGVYYLNGSQAVESEYKSPLNLGNPYINTGVTAILPAGGNSNQGETSGPGNGIDTFAPAGWFALNGNGEMTGTTWIEESGLLEGPIMLTNTATVGDVRDAVIQFFKGQQSQSDPDSFLNNFSLLLPVVAETYDGWLNDYLNVYQPKSDAYNATLTALDAIFTASGDNAQYQGSVGGGTGMTCYDWKGGIGTSSRLVPGTKSTVGVLVQANQGSWDELVILGAPVGPAGGTNFAGLEPTSHPPDDTAESLQGRGPKSSIIVVIATDAPLLPHQLKRLARRGALGIARTGTSTHNDSGELCIAFSTSNNAFVGDDGSIDVMSNDDLDPYFTAAVQAIEEAIINALIANQDNFTTPLNTKGQPHIGCAITQANLNSGNALSDILTKYGRM